MNDVNINYTNITSHKIDSSNRYSLDKFNDIITITSLKSENERLRLEVERMSYVDESLLNSETRRLDEKIEMLDRKIDKIESNLLDKIDTSSKLTINAVTEKQNENRKWFIGITIAAISPYFGQIISFLSQLFN